MEKLHLKTQDNISLTANALLADGPFAVVLMHAMPAIKESWSELAIRLNSNNVTVLVFDFRGHGESEGGHGTDMFLAHPELMGVIVDFLEK